MLKEAIDRILALAPLPVVTSGGHDFSTLPLTLIKAPVAKPLELFSLTALTEYLTCGVDERSVGVPTVKSAILVVNAPDMVTVVGGLDAQFQRSVFATVSLPHQRFGFGAWMDQESFLIAVMTLFKDDASRDGVLRLAGQVTAEQIATSADDGITQTASAKAGYVLANRLEIKNPVRLVPWRTFREVEQPASDFVLRVRKGLAGPEFALFEADGGAWKVEAAQSIRDFLKQEIPEATVLA